MGKPGVVFGAADVAFRAGPSGGGAALFAVGHAASPVHGQGGGVDLGLPRAVVVPGNPLQTIAGADGCVAVVAGSSEDGALQVQLGAVRQIQGGLVGCVRDEPVA